MHQEQSIPQETTAPQDAKGPLDGTAPIEIVKDVTLVGRRHECDLVLRPKSISKMHCIIVKTDGMLLLRDLGSTNGTRVNGQRVRRAALMPNDELTIAGFKFRIHFGQLSSGPLVLNRGIALEVQFRESSFRTRHRDLAENTRVSP